MREGEEEYRTFFELSGGVGNAQAEPETGRFLHVNRRFSEITGYSEEELLGLTIPKITHPDDREENFEGYRRVGRGEVARYDVEKRYVRKDGRVVWVRVSTAPIRDAAGGVSSVRITLPGIE